MQRIRTLSLILIVALFVQSWSVMAATAASAGNEVRALAGSAGPVPIAMIPSNGATAVVTNSSLKLTFDETIIRGAGIIIQLFQVGVGTAIDSYDVGTLDVQLDDANSSIVIKPKVGLTPGASYYVIVPEGAVVSYATGKRFAGFTTATQWTFQVEELVPVASFVPDNGLQTVDPIASGNLSFDFTRAVIKGSGYIQVKRAADNVTVHTMDIASDEVTINQTGLTVSAPLRGLEYSTAYYILIDPGALKDKANQGAFAGISASSWTFKTKPALDTTKPKATVFTPANNGILGNLTANVLTLKFDEVIFANANKSLVIRNATTNNLVCTVAAESTVSGTGSDEIRANLEASSCPQFINNTDYSVTIGPDVYRDASGNYFEGVTWKFKVLVDATPPAITAYSPAVSSTNVSIATTDLSLTFNEPLAALIGTPKAYIFPQNNQASKRELTMTIDPANNNRVLFKLAGAGGLSYSTAYSVSVPENVIKDVLGNAFAGISNPLQWTFQTGTNSTPVINTSTIDGANIVLTYSENLDSTKVPSSSNFYVTVNDVVTAVMGVSINNKEVRLSLQYNVLIGQTVKVSYFPDVLASRRLQNASGVEAASFSNQIVTNTTDSALPKPVSGVFYGSTLSLTLNRSMPTLPNGAQSQFIIKQNGNTIGVSSAQMNGNVLYLTLNSNSTGPQPVSITYTPGANPLRDQSGNLVPAFTDFYVRNIHDNALPTLSSAVLNGNKIVMNYNEGLNTASVPLKNSFSIVASGTNATLPTISSVAVVNNTIELTLSSSVAANVPVLLYYYPGTPPIVDLSNNAAPAIVGYSFTSGSGAVAQLSTLNISNSQITLVYSSTLSATPTPYANQYTVKYDGVAVPVTGVSVSGTQVILTVSTSVRVGQRVTLSYNATGIPLKDSLSQPVVAYNDVAVTNNGGNGSPIIGNLPEYLESDGGGGAQFVVSKSAMTSMGTTPSGKSMVRYTLDGSKLLAAYDAIRQNSGVSTPRLTFKVPSTELGAIVAIPVNSIMDASSRASNTSFRIEYGDTQFELPLTAVNYSKEIYTAGGSTTSSHLQLSIEKAPNAPVLSTLNILGAQSIATPADFSAGILTGTNYKAIDNYEQYVKRSFVIPSLNGATDNVSVIRLDTEANQPSYVPTLFENVGSTTKATFMRKGNSIYAVVRRNVRFTDMAKHWANDDVTVLASKFIVTGDTNKTFAPSKNITRADFAEFIARGIGLNGDRSSASRYSDVGTTNASAAYIGAVSKAGIVEGGTDGKFRPNAAVSREEMATMLVRAMNYVGVQSSTSSTALNEFKDKAKVSGWAKDGMSISVTAGFIKGSTTKTINPQSNASRAEAAIMIKRFLEYVDFL